MKRPSSFLLALVLAAANVYACSSSTDGSPQTAASDGGTATDDGSTGVPDSGGGSKDGGTGDTGKVDTTPAAITLTGKIAPTCTKFPAPPPEWDCNLNVTNLVMSPPAPSGGAISDAIEISSENKKTPDTGWVAGLLVSKPAYPATCLQNIAWLSSGSNLAYHAFDKVENGGTCGLVTGTHANVTPADFASGFSATLKVTWKASGKLVPATITFTP
jgi:hypothetical protein